MKCEEIWLEISNYVDGEASVSLRAQMDEHLSSCKQCASVMEGTRNVVRLMGDEKVFAPPQGFSQRIYSKVDEYLRAEEPGGNQSQRTIPFGITTDRVPLGSHLLYFWENDEDFARGVRFFNPGLGRGEHCIAFGHQEALDKVRSSLRTLGYDPEQLERDRQLTFLLRRFSSAGTLNDIQDVMEAAMRAGASAVRFLGNLGMGKAALPAGENDVVDLEHKASELISRFPGVIVCMYDVRTLSGHMVMQGGLREHELIVCNEGVRHNPYFTEGTPVSNVRQIH
jgi:DcmR-like sensory protein/putative zinc finger protein